MSSPSPSPRRRVNTADSPTRAWNSSNARVPVERPVSVLRTPFKKFEPGNPRGIPNPDSPAPKFDLSTTILKTASSFKLSKPSPKKEVKDYEVPAYDFSVRGNTLLKPVVQRRKPLTATPGQAASHIEPKARTPGVTTAVPDKPHVAIGTVVPASAVGLRVKKPSDIPLPDTPVAGPSGMANRLKKATGSVPLSTSPMGSALTRSVTSRSVTRLKKAPESVPLPASPAVNVTASVSTKPVKLTMPAMILMRQKLKPEVSQASAAELGTSLSPGTMKHVAPQLLGSETTAIGKATHPQVKRKQRLAAQASIDGSGLGLSPSKAAKAPAVHVGPSKAQPVVPHPAIDGAFKDPKSPPNASPKLERQFAPNGEVFLVSTKPLRLQTKLQVSPRSGAARVVPTKNVSPKGKGPALPIKVIMGGGNVAGSSNRLVSDSTSTAADDERDGVLQYSYQAKVDLEHRKKNSSEEHVLVVYPQVAERKPFSRRVNSASDPVASSASKHTESIEYQAKQYLSQTLNPKSLLDVQGGAQKALKTSPLVKSSPDKDAKVSAEYSAEVEAAYQAMIMKAYFDERPAIRIKLGRPRSRHRHGSSGQTQVASDVRDGSSSEFSVDFLKSEASQKIIQQTFVKLDMHGSGWSKQPLGSPIREPVSPRNAEYGNFSKRLSISPSERDRAREFSLGWASEQPHGHNFHLSSDHPMSPLRHMSRPLVPSSSTIRSNDAFEHFDDADYDEIDYSGVCADSNVLEAELQRLERELAVIPQSQYPGDQHVDDVAALEVLVDLEAGVGEQRQASLTTDTTTVNATATTVELPHKSALSMSHRGSVSSHKSVRWDPSIDEIATPVVQGKGKGKAVETVAEVVKEKKSRYELQLEDLFKQASGANGDSSEARIVGLGLETVRTLRLKGEEHRIAGIMKLVHEAIAFDDDEEGKATPVEVAVAAAPPAKLNPLVPEFTPRNIKENAPWALNLGPCEQYNHTGMLGYEVDDWRKPSPPREGSLRNPSFEGASSPDAVVEENLFHDPAVLSISPGRKRVGKFDMSSFDSTHQSISAENFVDSLFDSGDPAILRVGQSPSRHLRAISDQTFATTDAISVPATAASQTVRKRVIWDDPDEPGGREVAILSKKYAERFLTRFEEKYPLTGTKAKVVPKKKLEDLPKKLDEDLLLNGVASLKPKKLATDAADVQQRLELLLLKKKEAKVKKMRSASGSGLSEWGVRVEG